MVVECRSCDREVAGSNFTRGWAAVYTPTQHAVAPESVNEYERKLGVNGHTTRCNGHASVVLQRAEETEIRTPHESLVLGKDISYILLKKSKHPQVNISCQKDLVL